VELHVSQSQKNIGVRPVLVLPGFAVKSAVPALIPTSNANNLPVPSFRNEAAHTGLAHLPSMGVLCVKFSGRFPNFAHAAHIVGVLQTKDDLKKRMGEGFFAVTVYRLVG
jgi:hypothetical protein